MFGHTTLKNGTYCCILWWRNAVFTIIDNFFKLKNVFLFFPLVQLVSSDLKKKTEESMLYKLLLSSHENFLGSNSFNKWFRPKKLICELQRLQVGREIVLSLIFK